MYLSTQDILILGNVRSESEYAGLHMPADFETAIAATGFGKFNIIIIIVAIPVGFSTMFETTTMSYVFPAAQCDLDLTLHDKGLLNAITYIGMMTSAFAWGFFGDTLSRRKLILVGFFLNGVLVILSGFSQNFDSLIILKFFGGFIINGPFGAMIAYLSELNSAKNRDKVLLFMGSVYSFGNVLLALIALGILPLDFDTAILNNTFRLHSWNLYLFICSLPALIGFITFIFLPESPKYLMTKGQNERALKIFRKIYSMNTGKAGNMYPIHELVDEVRVITSELNQVTLVQRKRQVLKDDCKRISTLCLRPHITNMILLCFIQMFAMLSLNTIRLWIPQIFQIINDYEQYNKGTTANLCTMWYVMEPSINLNNTQKCSFNKKNSSVYLNTAIITTVNMIFYIVISTIFHKIGKKILLSMCSLTSGLAIMALYFTKTYISIIVVAAILRSSLTVPINVVISVVVNLFPTNLRMFTVSVTMLVGRFGSILGNLLFPILLESGCAPPFFTVGGVMLGCALLTFLLPETDFTPLH